MEWDESLTHRVQQERNQQRTVIEEQRVVLGRERRELHRRPSARCRLIRVRQRRF